MPVEIDVLFFPEIRFNEFNSDSYDSYYLYIKIVTLNNVLKWWVLQRVA